MDEIETSKSTIKYPVIGLLSLLSGYLILAVSEFNIHSGEMFLFLIVYVGFVLILPIVMLFKSLNNIAITPKSISSRKFQIVLTALLGLVLISLFIVSLFKK
jgi:hypothetical protein